MRAVLITELRVTLITNRCGIVRDRGVWSVNLEVLKMNLARLLFPSARDSDEIKSVLTVRRMLKRNNCVVPTEETRTREGLVIDDFTM